MEIVYTFIDFAVNIPHRLNSEFFECHSSYNISCCKWSVFLVAVLMHTHSGALKTYVMQIQNILPNDTMFQSCTDCNNSSARTHSNSLHLCNYFAIW